MGSEAKEGLLKQIIHDGTLSTIRIVTYRILTRGVNAHSRVVGRPAEAAETE